ncbi:MAG TPA: thioesterase family protein [Mycolicibacillus parakoreensis]|nr:thioesterase family protein [Mycolicibacillus parakoreensis]
MSSPHPFDRALDLEPTAPTGEPADTVRGRTHPAWANMVGPFGGITAATLLHAAATHRDVAGDPVALTVNFAGPIADGAFSVTRRAVRTNRSTQHWTLQLTQGDAVATTATAVFGAHRDTWADTEITAPPAPAPDQVPRGGLADSIAWAQRYDMRFTEGPLPTDGTASASSTTTLWVRDAAGRPLDFPALAALADVFYPRVFLRRGGFVPASTISLTTYFHVDAAELADLGDDYLLADAHANRFSRGYFDQSAHLWSRAGQLVASTHQLVYFKT